MTCPGCGGGMTTSSLAGQYGRTIAIDVCPGCNHVWFDGHEDLHLAPGAVVALFEDLGKAVAGARAPVGARKPCPRCGVGLLRTHDRVADTRYEYFRCTLGHGRLMSFASFLRARHFVRDLRDDELRTLRVDARVVKCVNCGAAVDITAHSACEYCRSPLAILDAEQLSRTLADLADAETRRTTLDPTWPLRAAQARRDTEAAFAALQRGQGVTPDVDLVEAGLAIFARIAQGLRTGPGGVP